MRRSLTVLLAALAVASSCGGDDGGGPTRPPADELVADVREAVDAVEAELGGPQEYFEVTAGPQFTNVFVAVDDATAAVPYLYVDGELQDPAPVVDGASGFTFTASAIDFDESVVLSRVREEVPDVSIDTFSVEGGPEGSVRYVVAARSTQGGVLDIVVGPRGAVISVAPA